MAYKASGKTKGLDGYVFLQQLREGRIPKLCLFFGQDSNLKTEALRIIRQALLPEGLEALNETILENPTSDQIVAAAETFPFMADKRLVIIRDYSPIEGRSEGDADLCEYLRDTPEGCVLIFLCGETLDTRKKTVKVIQDAGAVVCFDFLRGDNLNRWMISEFSGYGILCTPREASLLAFIAGNDTATLKTEIAKIASYCGEQKSVKEADIRNAATRSTECTVFEMVDAVVAGQESRAYRMLQDMLVNGESRLGIMAMLLRQYRILQQMMIADAEKRPPNYVSDIFHLMPFAEEKCRNQLRSMGRARNTIVRESVNILIETEYGIKNGTVAEEGSLEAALLRMFALRHPDM